SHSPYAEKGRVGGPETKRNYALAGGFANMLSIREADWVLTETGLKRPGFIRMLSGWLNNIPLWRSLLAVKRKINSL
ncbi:MAG: hypothetical protein PHR23_05995, partial [bacterium]|nr:hypothetical protein [bacterium]